jgi:hypothetical protein
MSYPAYQCFKTDTDQIYCSRTKVKSHAVGARWVSDCLTHHGLQSAQIRNRPYTSNSQPDKAIIYP